jgi:hypothetical protein
MPMMGNPPKRNRRAANSAAVFASFNLPARRIPELVLYLIPGSMAARLSTHRIDYNEHPNEYPGRTQQPGD